jgi:hypothetical protein
MEPSCLAVFKDELGKMRPHDDDAARLARNSYHFAEFFQAFDIPVPDLGGGKALLWGHCHQRATGGMDPDQKLLEKMGAEVDNLKGGCCGLAGSWGFERDKYEISMDCGEQALLPAVRDQDDGTLVVADGFSCKTQIEHAGTGRRALHLAEVMAIARERMAAGPARTPGGRQPERSYGPADRPTPPLPVRAARTAAAAMTVLAVAAAGTAGSRALRRGIRPAGTARTWWRRM